MHSDKWARGGVHVHLAARRHLRTHGVGGGARHGLLGADSAMCSKVRHGNRSGTPTRTGARAVRAHVLLDIAARQTMFGILRAEHSQI